MSVSQLRRRRAKPPKCAHCGRPSATRVRMRPPFDRRFTLEVCDPPYRKAVRDTYRSCAKRLEAQGWERV